MNKLYCLSHIWVSVPGTLVIQPWISSGTIGDLHTYTIIHTAM